VQIGIAVLGGGHWGPHLIRNFHDNGRSRVEVVVEPRADRRAALFTRFKGVRIETNADSAFDSPKVDAVVISTPTSTHYQLARRALESGKHVLVEKPLTDNVKAALELCELAEQTKLVLMVGHVFLFNPAIQAAKAIIDEDQLGDLYYASMVRTNLGPVRTDVNAAWDLASHDISIANYWLRGAPVAVSARGGSWLNSGIDDAVFATIDYEGGTLVHVHASWLHPRKARFISVVGSKRMLTVNDMDLSEPLRIYDKGVEDRPAGDVNDTFAAFRAQIREGAITIPSVSVGEPLRAECEEFIERATGGVSGVSDGWSGLEVVRVLEAIALSAQRRGTTVSLSEVGG
jgi:predicted dehydrogenase